MTAETNTVPGFGTKKIEESVAKNSLAVWYWGVTGIVFAALQCWIFWQWYASGDMKPVNPGISVPPDWMSIALNLNDIFWGGAIVVALFLIVIRPKLRTGRISLEGLFCLAFVFSWWQDPLFNYLVVGSTYNSTAFNLGSWACHIPAWSSPAGCLTAEPLTWNFALYFIVFPLAAILGCDYLRKSKLRNPGVRLDVYIFKLFGALLILDVVIELTWIGMGLYHYGGANNVVSIFDETRFKFPLFRPILLAFTLVVLSMLLYFQNDAGETVADKGVSKVQAGSGAKTWMRFFAYVGCINVTWLCALTYPMTVFQLSTDAWPAEIQKRSYFTNGICGDGTTYICGGRDGGRPRADPNAIRLGPNGEVIVPPGAKLPKPHPNKVSLSGENVPPEQFGCRQFPVLNKIWPCGDQKRFDQ